MTKLIKIFMCLSVMASLNCQATDSDNMRHFQRGYRYYVLETTGDGEEGLCYVSHLTPPSKTTEYVAFCKKVKEINTCFNDFMFKEVAEQDTLITKYLEEVRALSEEFKKYRTIYYEDRKIYKIESIIRNLFDYMYDPPFSGPLSFNNLVQLSSSNSFFNLSQDEVMQRFFNLNRVQSLHARRNKVPE